MLTANVWAKGDANSNLDQPYQTDSLPASVSPQEQEATKAAQDKKEQEKKNKLRAAATRRANEILGDPPPTSRAPENDSNYDDESPGAAD